MTRVQASIKAVERMQDAAQVAIVKADIALRGMRKGADEMQATVDDIKLCGGLLLERDGKLYLAGGNT